MNMHFYYFILYIYIQDEAELTDEFEVVTARVWARVKSC